MKKILFGFLFFIAFAFNSFATDYYVSPSGINDNSANRGSLSLPFQTIQYAANRTNPGDNVFIMNGTYNSTNGPLLTINRSGNASNYITFKPLAGHTPLLTASGNVWDAVVIDASYIIFEGLEMEGNNANLTLSGAQTSYNQSKTANPTFNANFNTNAISVAKTGNPHHIVIKNCKVHDFPAGGIGVGGADYITIEGNTVYNNSWYTMYATSGISILGPKPIDAVTTYKIIIRGNICYGNKTQIVWRRSQFGVDQLSDGNGIIIDANNGTQGTILYTGRTLVENNVSYNNGGGGVHAYEAGRVDIINNTTYNNGTVVGYPEIDGQDSEDIKIFNNIMYARTGGNCNANDIGAIYDHNIYFNGPSFKNGTNDIIANPRFVNLALDATANFRLSDISPAINSGSNVTGQFSSTDILGTTRPNGTRPDRGAYEFTGTPAIIPTFTPNNIVVLRVGNGITTLSTAALPVNILEFTPSGTAGAMNVVLSNAASIAPNRLLLSGDGSTGEGQLNLSSDGRYLTVAGYEAAVNDAPATYQANAKVISRVTYLGEPDYSTRIASSTLNGTVRSTVTAGDNTRYFITGTSTSPASVNSTRFLTFGSSTSSTAFNGPVRSLAMFKGQVYYANSNVVGSLTPNPASGNFATNVTFPGVSVSGHNYQSLTLLDADPSVSYLTTGYDILYCADATLGLVKFYWNGTTWVLAGTFNPTVSGVLGGLYALTARLNSEGKAEIFAVKGNAANNVIVSMVDQAGLTGSINVTMPTLANVAASGANFMFRGVAFAPSQFTTLPIELTEFKAQFLGNVVKLNWSTSLEVNAKEFIIERTIDGKNFIELGKIAAKNNSTGASYLFYDDQLPSGLIYYRLKSVDFDGSYKLSNIVSVKNLIEVRNSISISPVPVLFDAEISHPLADLNAELKIVDSRGVLIKSFKITPNTNITKLNLSDLTAGFYIITFQNTGKFYSCKFVK